MMKRVYRIGGMRFIQRPLTYRQWELIREVLKGKNIGITALTPDGVGDWVDRSMEAKALPRLAAIVLKRYEPTRVHRWLNERAFKKQNRPVEEILTDSPVLPTAVADFFVLNVSWWETWLNTPLRSGWLTKSLTPGQATALSARLFSTLATATSSPQNGGATSPR